MNRIAAIVAGLLLAFVGTSNAWAVNGACCIIVFSSTGDQPYNTCIADVDGTECADMGGVYMGDGLTCDNYAEVDGICRQINVDANYDSDCSDLYCWKVQNALNEANDGDLVYISHATHSYQLESLSMGGKKVTIAGKTDENGDPVATLKTTANASVFYLHEGETNQTVIRDLIITGGDTAGNGGGINLVGSSPTIRKCWILNNNAYFGGGGGISCDNSNPTILNCRIDNNHAKGGGGLYCTNNSNPTITDGSIDQNYGASGAHDDEGGGGAPCCGMPTCFCPDVDGWLNGGGGIWLESCSPTFTNVQIDSNYAETYFGQWPSYGGGIYMTSGSLPIFTDCSITNNVAWGDGGGVYVEPALAYNEGPTFNNCGIYSNCCCMPQTVLNGQGGGIMYWNAYPTVNGGSVLFNSPNNLFSHDVALFRGDGRNGDEGEYGSSFITLNNTTVCGEGDHIVGAVLHIGENNIHDCRDDGDLNGDGVVDVDDLHLHHGVVGICLSDVDHNGVTDVLDLLVVIEGWGSVCP